ncbi:MAG TPA: ABC transporter ATP-binding protein [Dehalococcoidia bacterium]|jgi:heme ABC exporter ATP-binding subunit CcmA|nr:sodium ABC transporter ATP-binding protein [Chloroflexota bacterium]MDP5878133.1 ABC transporter ATP-binding protein [Dehalococcoidia bacterium]MDP7160363.1 ABC transporter ATP-binding protein [Dehalococcoidia bacterium]MDP7213887.1 ABC transporter ATP-binding protein [Dehalococcoidia bacterium]MDP7513468.1 ABC transporter ATP-binding protein [Dehalococcoidia bacterium]
MTSSTQEAPARDSGSGVLAIEAVRLEKSFGNAAVLRGLDMTVRDGEVVAVFGANGVGKSTLLRVLTTLTRLDHGTISVYGSDLSRRPEIARLLLGAVLHSPMLYGDLTVKENLSFFGKMFRVPRLADRVSELADRMGLTPRLDQKVRELSHGYQKRAALARTLLHRPRLLLLDEAETGLDESARVILDGVISEHRAAGRAVVMTTHSIERGIAGADRVLVLAGGRIALDRPSSQVTPNDVTGLYGDLSSPGSGDA